MQTNEPSHHLLRITIHITHISLSVRFPCTLQLSLKNNLQIISSKTSTELKQGQCSPNEKLTLEVEVPFNNKTYIDKNIAILVSMISSNGKIPAGCVDVKITDQGKIVDSRDVIKRDIEKCPDRNASMELSVVVEFIQALSRNNSLNMHQFDKHSNSRVLSQSEHHQNWEHIKKTNNSENTNMRIKGNKNLSEIRENSKTLRKSPVKIDYTEEEINEHSIIEDEILLTSHKPITTNLQTKELEKIKSELNLQKKESQYKINSLEDQLIKYKTEIDILTEEQLQNKNKIRLMERNEKELQNENKDYKEQIIKCKNKIILLEKHIQDNKAELEANEKAFVTLQKQLSEQKEQIEEKTLSITVLEKKLEYKENTLNEHCNKIMEKYQNSENERLKAVKELNEMLMEYEGREKKMQLTSKDKERDHLDEKNKLSKKIELLIVQNSELTEKVSELTTLTLSLQSEINFSTVQKIKLEEELSSITEKLSITTHTSQTQSVTLLQQKQTLSLQEKQAEEFNILNKKHIQMQQEYNKIKEVCSKLETKVESMSKENKQMESQIKDCKSERDKVENRAGELAREVQKFKKVTEGKDAEIESLQQTITNLTTKLGELRIKIDSQNLEHETTLNRLSGEILYLHKTNESLTQELQEQNSSLVKVKELHHQQCIKIQELNEQILKLNEDMYLEQEKVRKGIELKREIDMKIGRMTTEIESREEREKGLQGQLREKTELEHSQMKIIKEKEQELFILKSQFSSLQSTLSESQEAIETLNSQLSVLTEKLNEEKLSSSSQNNFHLLTISDQIKQIEKLELEVKYNQNMSEELKMVMQVEEKGRAERDREIELLKERVNEEVIKIEKLEKKLEAKEAEIDNYKKDFTKYKQDNEAAIEKFMIEINKDIVNTTTSISYQTHILTFPDNNINLLQIQSLKKKHELIVKYIQQIENKDEEIKILNIETQKLKELHKEREEELELEVIEIKNKIKQVQHETMAESSELLEKVHALEEKNAEKCLENDKLTQELHLLTQTLEELELSHSQTMKSLNENSAAYEILQEKLQASLLSYNTLQSHNDHQIQTIGEENKNQIEKYKNIVKEIEKKNGELGRELEEKGKKVEELERKNGQLQGELERTCQKILVSEGKLDEFYAHKRQLEERIFQEEAKTAEQINQKEKLQQQISSERLKTQELSLQIKSLSESLHSLQTEHSTLEYEHSTLKETTSSQSTLSEQSLCLSQQTIEKLTQSISKLQEEIIKYKSENELQIFINEQLKETSADNKKEIKIIEKELEEKKTLVIKLKEELEDTKNLNILAKEDSEADKVERARIEIESRRYKETIQEMSEQVEEQRMIGQLLQEKNEEYSQLQLSYTALERTYELIKQEHSQCQLNLKKSSESHYSREEQYKNKIVELQKLLDVSQEEGKRLGIDVQSLDQESGKLRNKISQLERELSDMNISIASKCEQLEESEKTAKLLSIQIKTMTEEKEKKPHNVNNTSIYQQLVKDIDGRATRNNRAN